jgi:hypothetical protein
VGVDDAALMAAGQRPITEAALTEKIRQAGLEGAAILLRLW